jgi:ferric-dicitrate binding protein FerR (iron transport regulator)
MVTNEGSVSIKKGEQGELIYEGTDTEMKYNTVSTPRGGQYKLVLGDGTRVWLNAESSLKFPAGFSLNQREVELRGEAYFEVAKNPARPFKVTVLTPSGDGGTVEVLGTHFNINSYGDEPVVKTTLLEGSVRVTKAGHTVVIRPGEQAQAGATIRVVHTDTDQEVGWKEGEFVFRNATIQQVAAQLTRWYDVEVEYRGSVTDHFNATIDRKESLQSLLKLLEGTKRVHFTLAGKKLIIGP